MAGICARRRGGLKSRVRPSFLLRQKHRMPQLAGLWGSLFGQFGSQSPVREVTLGLTVMEGNVRALPRHNSEPRNPAQEQTRLRPRLPVLGPARQPGLLHSTTGAGPGLEAGGERGREEAEQDTAPSAVASLRLLGALLRRARPLGSPDWSWEEKTMNPRAMDLGTYPAQDQRFLPQEGAVKWP